MADEQTAQNQFEGAREDTDKRVAELEATIAKREDEWAKQRDGLLSDTSAALAARDAAERRADAAEAALTKAKAKVSREPKAKTSRKLNPDQADGLTGDDLDDAIAKADAAGKPVEVVFSDGKGEIVDIPPVKVEGEVWKSHTLGKMLLDPVCVTGPDAGKASFVIWGYALLIDGKQVAYCKRGDPINVAPGNKINIADDIYF